MAINIEIIDTVEQFNDLQPLWNSVLTESEHLVPFLTYEWVSSWWEAYGEEKALYIIKVCEDDICLGIAPLYLNHHSNLKCLEFIGGDRSDYLDFIVRKGTWNVFITAIMKYLNTRSDIWDMLLLKNIYWSTEKKEAFKICVEAAYCELLSRSYTQAPILAIDNSWEEYLRSCSKTKKIRKKERRLQKNGNYIIERVTDFTTPLLEKNIFEVAKTVESTSWKYIAGNPRLQTDERAERFFKALLAKFCQKGWIDFWFLLADGVPRAYAMNFVLDNKVFAYNSAYDETFKLKGIGALLHIHRIRDAFDRSLSEYDFLRGTEGYKSEWTEERRDIEEIAVFNKSVKSRLLAKTLLRLRWWLATVDWVKDLRYRLICLVNRNKLKL